MIGLLFIPLVYLPGVLPLITHINAVVNEPVTLPCEMDGPNGTKWTAIHPNTADISDCDRVPCSIKEPFRKRFSLSGDRTRGSSLLISPVYYNDRGSYRCSCCGENADVKLKVFVPTVVKAHELENVLLPCYGDTRKEAKDLLWNKDKQLVLLYDDKTGNVTLGEGAEDRFSISPETFQGGDLSLNISSLRKTDAGLYLCSIHDESREGDPRAILLEVEEQNQSWCPVAVIILALIIVASAAIGVYCSWSKISCCIRGPACDEAHTDPPPSVQEQSMPMLEETSSVKVSSTRPF